MVCQRWGSRTRAGRRRTTATLTRKARSGTALLYCTGRLKRTRRGGAEGFQSKTLRPKVCCGGFYKKTVRACRTTYTR